jgi:hypothetical protein
VTIVALMNDHQNYIFHFGAWLMVGLNHEYIKVSLMSLNKQLQQIMSLTLHSTNLLNYCTKAWKIKGKESVKMKEKRNI